ncbi:MAG: hypothetical protein FJZ98_08245, partial [Chloroflexi bacterium]|nr:hypothetical protein [Chloroflexota bacterium]
MELFPDRSSSRISTTLTSGSGRVSSSLPVAEPVEAPLAEPVEAPLAEPVEAPLAEPVEAPLAEP